MRPYYEADGITLYHGDALDALAELPAMSVDAVITDPPYMIGAISVGTADSKAGTWADMENAAHWFSAWFAQSKRILKPTGYLATFGNWRSLPTLIYALSRQQMPATSCLVWDKGWIGPAGPAQLRPRYELIVLSAMPEGKIADRGAPDVISEKWMAGQMKTTNHPAEKPVPLLRRLVDLLTPAGGVVVDPFMGSGTTGVACRDERRLFIGCERDPDHIVTAKDRITHHMPQTILELGGAA